MPHLLASSKCYAQMCFEGREKISSLFSAKLFYGNRSICRLKVPVKQFYVEVKQHGRGQMGTQEILHRAISSEPPKPNQKYAMVRVSQDRQQQTLPNVTNAASVPNPIRKLD